MKTLQLIINISLLALCLSCSNSNESPSETEVDRTPGAALNDSILNATKNPSDTASNNDITATHDHKK